MFTSRTFFRFTLLTLPFALSPKVPAAAGEGPADTLEQIVVTARKREENLSTTPVAVTAFTEASLQKLGINTVTDLGHHVANLSMISGQGGGTSQTQISIRGVGQSDFILTTDQSVGVYVDGVYYPRSLGAALDLMDIQRIEVLRGPQGTLFGRNTTAGAVQIISKPVEDHLTAAAEVTAGSYDRADIKVSVNTPLASDRLIARLNIASLNQGGYGERFADGTDGANHNTLAGRLQLHGVISEDLAADLTVDASHKRGHGGLETLVDVNPSDPTLAFYNSLLTSQGLPPVDGRWITSNPHDTWAGERNRDDNDNRGIALTFNWKLGASSLRSITAYRRLEAHTGYSFLPSPYPVAEQELNLDQSQWSQELQLYGTAFGDRVDWIGGLFYFREGASDYENVPFFQPVVATGPDSFIRVPGGFSFVSYISQITDSYAGYGQATYHFNDRLSATAGARVTWEQKDLDSYLSGAFVRAPGEVSHHWDNFSPRAGLEYRFSPEWFGYASVSRGFRSGGFNGRDTSPLPPTSFDPEEITAYELGLKIAPESGRWRLNGATYFYDYKNFQGLTLKSFSGITITVGNIANVRLWGAEFDLTSKVTDRLELGVSTGYSHQDISHVDPDAKITIRPDTRLVNSPTWTGSIYGDLTLWSGARYEFLARADFSFKSRVEFFLPNYPDEGQPAYGLLDAHATFRPIGARWSIELGGTNLTDRAYRTFAENGTALGVAATSAVYGPPRQWDLRLRAAW
ncbi:MAG TPA: TonB-dependent receptor [Steroidobacteraceae bacterium]|nr:TonB-dependent receptor [Steroidobacteraceae bacterium]